MPAYIVKIRKKDDLNALSGIQKTGTTVYKIRLNNNNNINNNNNNNNNLNGSKTDHNHNQLVSSSPSPPPIARINSLKEDAGSEGGSVYLNESLRPLGCPGEVRAVRLAGRVCSVVGRSASSKVSPSTPSLQNNLANLRPL